MRPWRKAGLRLAVRATAPCARVGDARLVRGHPSLMLELGTPALLYVARQRMAALQQRCLLSDNAAALWLPRKPGAVDRRL